MSKKKKPADQPPIPYGLTEPQWELVQAYVANNMDIKATSKQTGIPEGTIRLYLFIPDVMDAVKALMVIESDRWLMPALNTSILPPGAVKGTIYTNKVHYTENGVAIEKQGEVKYDRQWAIETFRKVTGQEPTNKLEAYEMEGAKKILGLRLNELTGRND